MAREATFKKTLLSDHDYMLWMTTIIWKRSLIVLLTIWCQLIIHHWRASAPLALDEDDQLPMMYSLGNISRQPDYHHNDNDPQNDGNDS